ncbi:hypothetical protein [Rhodococcus oxybenzonivorans]|uniref:hypothetical protein n=1 Tax=Rhodococcus oxybenzonivorans TaxID=1990687 RepID=UPI0013A5478F|nr:hypothetical protein [Rhodococcus oxybenzonivorans]
MTGPAQRRDWWTLRAIHNAGPSANDIDGVVTYGGNIDDRLEIQLVEYLGLYETPIFAPVDLGGAETRSDHRDVGVTGSPSASLNCSCAPPG